MEELSPDAGAVVRATVLGAWAALGAPALAAAGAALEGVPLVDPEALVTLSCALAAQIPQMERVLQWWAAAGGVLLHPERLKRLAAGFAEFPSVHPEAVGRQPRWAGGASVDAYCGMLGAVAPPRLSCAAAAVLRARVEMGVNVKADACVLLAVHPGLTAVSLAAMTGCSVVAARQALGYAALEGWARGTPRRERRFFPTPRLLSALAPFPDGGADAAWTRWTAALWLARRLSAAPVDPPPLPAGAGRTLGEITAWLARPGGR